MAISKDIQERMKTFTKKQAPVYLQDAEMTYMEKLRHKVSHTKRKINTKLKRFKNHSNSATEAQEDMFLYMHDYMEDLISHGMDEESAFNKAKEDLTIDSESIQVTNLQEHFQEYYALYDPSMNETIGLLYGGFVILGGGIGGLIGFLSSGALSNFRYEGWIYTSIGASVGLLLGVGMALLCNAYIIAKKTN